MGESAATFVRIVMAVGCILAVGFWCWQAWVGWRRLSWGEKMLVVGVAGFMLYAADALRASIEAGLEWQLRMAPLAVGLASVSAFLLEPFSSKNRWWGRRLLLQRKDPQAGDDPVDEP